MNFLGFILSCIRSAVTKRSETISYLHVKEVGGRNR